MFLFLFCYLRGLLLFFLIILVYYLVIGYLSLGLELFGIGNAFFFYGYRFVVLFILKYKIFIGFVLIIFYIFDFENGRKVVNCVVIFNIFFKNRVV